MAAIEMLGVTKAFGGGAVALSNLDLRVPAGAVYGMIGRNGSGKTTALRVMMGLLRADSGWVRLLGQDMWSASRGLRSRVTYIPQGQQLHGWMTTQEICRYVGHFYESWDMGYARRLAREWEIPWGGKVGVLSHGEQRKVALLLAFSARPEVMLLDEPAAGFDVVTRRQLMERVIELVSGESPCTVVFSTHMIGDLERVASHVGILAHGRMEGEYEVDGLMGRVRRVQVVFGEGFPPPGFEVPGAWRSRIEGPVVTAVVPLVEDEQLDAVRRISGVRVNVFPMSLEEIFLELHGGCEGGVGASGQLAGWGQ